MLLLSVVSALIVAQAQEASGFVEVRGLYYAGVDGEAWQLVERARPSFEAELGDRVLVASTVEALFTQGRRQQEVFQDVVDSALADSPIDLFEAYGCSWPEPARNSFFGIDSAQDYLGVERLYVDVYLPAVDLRVGRQSVRWGSALLINPTDPFPEVLFTEPWRFRRGVNAARATIPLGNHTIGLVAGMDDAFLQPRLAGRATFNAVGTDFSVVAAYRGETDDGLVGLDIRGTAGVGFWFEGALHIDGDGVYEELAVGIDTSFPVLEQLVVAAQYYRYGQGSSSWDPEALSSRVAAGITAPECTSDDAALFYEAMGIDPDAEPDPFAPAFSGRDYALLAVTAGLMPEVGANLAALQNLGDGTGFFIPTVTARPTGWWEASVSAQVPYRLWGDGGEFRPPEQDLSFGGQDLAGLLPDATFIVWTRATF